METYDDGWYLAYGWNTFWNMPWYSTLYIKDSTIYFPMDYGSLEDFISGEMPDCENIVLNKLVHKP